MLGDALIADGVAQSILLCPLSVGGATVGEWAPGGTYHHRMIYGIERLREAGFHPSYVLWHQGEADALYGTSADDYANAFRALAQSLRDLDIRAPIYVAIASYFAVPEGYGASQAVIRRAQQSLISPGTRSCPVPTRILSGSGSMVATWEVPGYESMLRCGRHLSAARDIGST